MKNRDRKTYLPFSNPGSVLHFRPLNASAINEKKISAEEKIFLYSKHEARIVLLNLENNLPVFHYFEPKCLKIPLFPTKQNFSKNNVYFQYSQVVTEFHSLIDRNNILLYFPEENYHDVAVLSMGAYFLRDHTIRPEELLEYFEGSLEPEVSAVALEDLKNYLYGEYYLTFLSTKLKPKVSLQLERKLHLDNEPLPKIKQEIPEVRVQLVSTENQIPYELDLTSLHQPETELTVESEDMISFNLTSLTPAEFTPESEDGNRELLEDVLGMAETFDIETLDLDEESNFEEIPKKESEFIQISQIPRVSPKNLADLGANVPKEKDPITIPEPAEILRAQEISNTPLPSEPSKKPITVSLMIEEKKIGTDLSMIDPIFGEDFVPVLKRKESSKSDEKVKIHENFLGLPDNW